MRRLEISLKESQERLAEDSKKLDEMAKSLSVEKSSLERKS